MAQPADASRLSVAEGRSGCPINMTIELLGDRWSFIVLRDIMFGGRTRFRELLDHSIEGIASNVLASRLAKLTHAGLLTRNAVEGHRQKIDYFLTEAAIELVPIIVELGDWGSRWLPTTPELAVRARLLADGGPDIAQRFMDELRSDPPRPCTSTRQRCPRRTRRRLPRSCCRYRLTAGHRAEPTTARRPRRP